MNKEYLGDGVYIYMDEGRDQLVITTENGDGFPTNEIFLEGEILYAFMGYVKRRLPTFWQMIKEKL